MANLKAAIHLQHFISLCLSLKKKSSRFTPEAFHAWASEGPPSRHLIGYCLVEPHYGKATHSQVCQIKRVLLTDRS